MARSHRLLRGGAVLGAATLVAGCSFMTPIETQQPYAPGDGVRVELSESVRVENLMVLAQEEGAAGEVFGGLVNDSTEEVVMSVTIGDGGIQIPVPAGEMVLLGGVDETVVIPATPAPPGAAAEALVEASGYGTVSAAVPVLDDTLAPYEGHVPGS